MASIRRMNQAFDRAEARRETDMNQEKNPRAIIPLDLGQGKVVRADGDWMCLTDLWRVAGANDTRRPVEWLRQDQTKRFLSQIQDSGLSPLSRIVPGNPITHTPPETWAEWHVALAYAEYLSPAFHVHVLDVWMAWKQGRQSTGLDMGQLERAVEAATRGAMAGVVAMIPSLAGEIAKVLPGGNTPVPALPPAMPALSAQDAPGIAGRAHDYREATPEQRAAWERLCATSEFREIRTLRERAIIAGKYDKPGQADRDLWRMSVRHAPEVDRDNVYLSALALGCLGSVVEWARTLWGSGHPPVTFDEAYPRETLPAPRMPTPPKMSNIRLVRYQGTPDGDAFRQYRKAAKVTQEELGLRLVKIWSGWNKPALSAYELGRKTMPAEVERAARRIIVELQEPKAAE